MTAERDGPTWLGAVLAGGRSRRMGRDKASLELDDGRPMAARSVDALRALRDVPVVVTDVVLAGGDPGLAEELGAGFVADPTPAVGPVGGLLAALDRAAAAGHHGVVALPCDLPVLDPDALVTWCASAVRREATVVIATRDGRPQYPVGLWRVAGRDELAAARARGERSMRSILAGVDVDEVAAGPAFADADTPGELDAIRYPEGSSARGER